MKLDSGLVSLCTLNNTADAGDMPAPKLVVSSTVFYSARNIGYNRMYAAAGVNQDIDMLIRIWRDNSVKVGMYAVLEDDRQFEIQAVQHLIDNDGLEVSDLTLRRVDSLYDVIPAST